MHDALTLDTLMDMLLFEDLETANAKLAPYQLAARWIDANRGEIEIVSNFGGRAYHIGREFPQGDLFANERDEANKAEVTVAVAQEDSDAAAAEFFFGPWKEPESMFRGAVKEGDTDDRAKELEEYFRDSLMDPTSKLVQTLRFYAHGELPANNSPYDLPFNLPRAPPAPTVLKAIAGERVPVSEIETLLGDETLAKQRDIRNKQNWSIAVERNETLLGFVAWMAEQDEDAAAIECLAYIRNDGTQPAPSVEPTVPAQWPDQPDSLDAIIARIYADGAIYAYEADKAFVGSTSDERTVNNTMRSSYRVLNDDEKLAVDDIKVMGTIFVDYLEELGQSRENSIAKTKMEEAVMWAVKGLTK